MNKRTKIGLGGVAAVAALGAAGFGIAAGFDHDGDNDTPITGPDADKARAAALQAVGGGTAGEVEAENEGNIAYGVDVTKTDGTRVEVHLDQNYAYLGTENHGDHQ
ncbi:PepSY domain-containing protein [Nocardia sp. R6R-6]|uniref:PepSY domain-containing protein n=1 Tax=Nocardia sp. R6R-6 TaxID=3459303 RepID=UPI00403DD7BD